jgi:hypothetical protein
LEEPRPRPVGRPRKTAPKRPVQRVFRMAYCATVTFHDGPGEALPTLRYGGRCRPAIRSISVTVRADATAIHAERPDLALVSLCDGSPETRALLRSALDETVLGASVCELLDFWHLLDKLAPAAQVPYGEAEGDRGAPSISTALSGQRFALSLSELLVWAAVRKQTPQLEKVGFVPIPAHAGSRIRDRECHDHERELSRQL